MEWSDGQGPQRTSKFVRRLDYIREHQSENPEKWGQIAEYDSYQVAHDTATRLRKRYRQEFKIKAMKHPETGKGVVLVRVRRDTNE